MATTFVTVKDVATQDELRAAGLLWWHYTGYITDDRPIYINLKPRAHKSVNPTLNELFLGSYGYMAED